MTEPEQPHLIPKLSARGFKHMPRLIDAYGNEVRLYESSNAEYPQIWLSTNGAVSPLNLDEARQLSEQLAWLADHHYHHEESP